MVIPLSLTYMVIPIVTVVCMLIYAIVTDVYRPMVIPLSLTYIWSYHSHCCMYVYTIVPDICMVRK